MGEVNKVLRVTKLLIANAKKHSIFIPSAKTENLHTLQDSTHSPTHQTSAPMQQDQTPSWPQNQVFDYVVFYENLTHSH